MCEEDTKNTVDDNKGRNLPNYQYTPFRFVQFCPFCVRSTFSLVPLPT